MGKCLNYFMLETPAHAFKVISEFYQFLKVSGIVRILVKEKIGHPKTAVVADSLFNHDRFLQYCSVQKIECYLHQAKLKIEHLEHNIQDPTGRQDTQWIWAIARKK